MTRPKTYGDNAERQREYRKRRARKLERLTMAEDLLQRVNKDAILEPSEPGLIVSDLVEEIEAFIKEAV